MSKALWIALSAAGLALAAAGCTDDQIARINQFNRRFQYPSDWNDDKKLPLGRQFDTRPEIQQLADPELQRQMFLWLDTREQYLSAWRRGGDYDPEVKRLQNRLATLTVVIQSRRDQLAGQPLTRGG